jgi:hypothetical protein
MSPPWDSNPDFKRDAEWAAAKIQPLALPFYKRWWPGAEVEELDRSMLGGLDRLLDFAGHDKMLYFPSGNGIHSSNGLRIFLAQRFRRFRLLSGKLNTYDQITLRKAEWERAVEAVEEEGSLAGYYVYGKTNEPETGFAWLLVLRFRRFVEWAKPRPLREGKRNSDRRATSWYYWPIKEIPVGLFVHQYDERVRLD